MLGGVLVLLVTLTNHNPQFDIVACLILLVGGVQFVRHTMHGQVIAGLRAAVIGVALVLAMVTPWMLTITIVACAILFALHLLDTRGIPRHRLP
jgi:hypothetical protein